MYKRFLAWLAVTICLLSAFVVMLGAGASVNTNIMDLLPKGNQDFVTSKAINHFSKTQGNQVIFLVGNPSKALAVKAADAFYRDLILGDIFTKIQYKIDDQQQAAWGHFYFPYRLSLLTPMQQKLLLSNNTNQIKQNALFNLYNPIGISSAELIESDPYFLFQKYITSLPKPASNIQLQQQRMIVQGNHSWYVMITGQLKGNSFSLSNQKKVISIIKQSQHFVEKAYPTTRILKTGMLFYAKAGSDQAQHDISTIGIGSLIGIILLMLLTFRSLSPLVFTLLSGVLGFIAAFVVTYIIFGSVYLFTLVFGASLIGIAVDYAFFFYSEQLLSGKKWNPVTGLKNILPGISLGLLNIILAYIVLAFTPFPGLKQLAVFAAVGLGMAFSTVVCAFPLLLKAQREASRPVILRITSRYLEFWQKLSKKKIIASYGIILIVAVIGISMLNSNDNISILQAVNPSLKQQESMIKRTIGSDIGTNFFVVKGETPQSVLNTEKQVGTQITAAFPKVPHSYMAIVSYLPPIDQQKLNYLLVKKKLLNNDLIAYLEKIGIMKNKAAVIGKKLGAINFRALTLEDWKHSSVSQSMRFLWLGKIDKQYASVILLSNKLDAQTLQAISDKIPNAIYVNKVNEISSIFKDYRQKISYLLIIVYALLFTLLFLRYSLKRAILYFLPPLASVLLSLAFLGLLHIPLTLFSILALFLVLGIAVDYVLFFAETRSNYQSTMLAISLSAITTILSFGLLALSSTPVIHYFGITVFVGIASAFLLSPLVARIKIG